MASFARANELYKQGRYQEALDEYAELGKIFGSNLVSYQIQTLEKLCGSKCVINVDNLKTDLDCATKILLANSGERPLSKDELSQLILDWKIKTAKKSDNAEIRNVNPIPSDFPKDLVLEPLPQGVNDFNWCARRRELSKLRKYSDKNSRVGLSIIVTTFNRSNILSITLTCLVNQKTRYPFEVIVADDGSHEELIHVIRDYEKLLDIRYVRQKDMGFQASATRNMGLKLAKYDFIGLLDCDMAPNPLWVESYLNELIKNDDLTIIGPRKYIDTQKLSPRDFLNDTNLLESLPEVITNNNVAGKIEGTISIDWRLEHFTKTENLRLSDSPFRFFAAGNVAFAKKWLSKVGLFDEEFNHWGGEDVEFGYRLFRYGSFFKVIDGVMAYHQEPPGKENETDREAGKDITLSLMREKVPYIYRKLLNIDESFINKNPLVSIYVPAYNCEKYIQRCVDSALNQTITDLEVCICNDGSTDRTLDLVNQLYGNNPRVKIISQENGGIASASNTAVSACSGYYIGQLDSDDYLEPDAVELCLKEFLRDRSLACVYTTNRNVNPDGSLIANGYNWPEFSREKLTTAMIVHHFRMFTIRAWNLTSGFNEKIENAVDYDMYLKLSEVGKFKHINRICYNRVLHGNNTSIKKLGTQKNNHFIVVNQSLQRQGITSYDYTALDDDDSSRKYVFRSGQKNQIAQMKDQQIAINRKRSEMVSAVYILDFPNTLEKLKDKISNILQYNPLAKAFIIHVDKQYLTNEISKQLYMLEVDRQVKIIINEETFVDTHKSCLGIAVLLDSFDKIKALDFIPDYVIFDEYDSLYVLPNSLEYIVKYDLGLNFSALSKEWQNKVSSHKTLVEFIAKVSDKFDLSNARIKGSPNGMFFNYDLAQEIFYKLGELLKLCEKNNDFPLYRPKDFWIQLCVLLSEEQRGTTFNKTIGLTYMPWERKLQWTKKQIEEAKQGIGISKNKFLINSIIG